MRGSWLIIATVVGCGRGRFDPAEGTGEVDAAATSPLPAQVCAGSVVDVEEVGADADLAVTSRDLGYVAAWTDGTLGAVRLAAFDGNRQAMDEPHVVVPSGVASLPGLEVATPRAWLVTSSGESGKTTLRAMSADLTASDEILSETSIPGFEPIAVGNQLGVSPIWVRASEKSLLLSYLSANGPGVDAVYSVDRLITGVSVADYTDHVHLGWREDSGQCLGVDVKFAALPAVASPESIADDCEQLRIVSGGEPYDPLVSTWTTSQGNVQVRYQGSGIPPGGSAFLVSLGVGRAPKVSFDGTAYWVAWRDGQGLRVARVDKDGATSTSQVTDFVPAGDEAFELVRRGSSVDLVVLGRRTLSFLSLCAADQALRRPR